MHEMALAHNMVEIAADAAANDGASRVLSVRVLIGALAHVDPRALEFGFEAASHGSSVEGAKLIVERGEGKAFCVSCTSEFIVTERHAPCPNCGSHQWLLLEGEEMRVVDMEVE